MWPESLKGHNYATNCRHEKPSEHDFLSGLTI